MEYLITLLKNMFSSKNQSSSNETRDSTKMSKINSTSSSTSPLNAQHTSSSTHFDTMSPSTMPFRIEFHIRDLEKMSKNKSTTQSEYTCCGWWELIVLRRVPNDLMFHSIGISLLENDDLSSVSQRIIDVLKDETNEKDFAIDPNTLWYREIPDGVNIQRLRHYLLTPGVRFLIISDSQDDIQTFVLRSAFKHWIKGLSPFRREYVWPFLFDSLLKPQFRPSYVTDDNNVWKIIQGSEKSRNETDDTIDSADEKTEPHRKLWYSSLPKRINLILNPHELETIPGYSTDIEISSPSSSEQTSEQTSDFEKD